MMRPIFITLSSSGSSPWKVMNWQCAPQEITFSVISTGGSSYFISATLEDPNGVADLICPDTVHDFHRLIERDVLSRQFCDGTADQADCGVSVHTQHAIERRREGDAHQPAVGDRMTASPDDAVAIGIAAWARLRDHEKATWADWLDVARALAIGRTLSLKDADTNRPLGSRYNTAMGAWLKEHGLADVVAQERYRLLLILQNIEPIEVWRAGVKLFATASAPRSSVSRAIFWASMTSPATRGSRGTKHQPLLGRAASSSSMMFAPMPWHMRYRLPVWQPMTSKYPCASYCASCSCESHSLKSLRPRCSLIPGRRHHSRKPRARCKQAARSRRSRPFAS
jgi:hypothetical protein